MRFMAQRGDILTALTRVARAVDARADKGMLPIMGNVLITPDEARSSITFTGTNLNVEVRVESAIQGLQQPVEIAAPAHILYEIVRRLPDGARIGAETDGNKLVLRAGRAKFSMQILNWQDFPFLGSKVSAENSARFAVKSGEFCKLLRTATFAATDDSRTFLTGVYVHVPRGHIDVLRAVSTDGHRFIQQDVGIYDPASTHSYSPVSIPGFIVPRRTAEEVAGLAKDFEGIVTVEVTRTLVRFMIGDTRITSRLVDGTFPEYTRIIPLGNDRVIDVDRLALRAALSRVTAVAAEDGQGIKTEITNDLLRLSVTSQTGCSATEEIPVEYDDESVILGINSRYLGEVLDNIGGELVTLRLEGPRSPILVSNKDDASTLAVVMPMQLS